MSRDLKVAVLGATGAVGREILHVLEERDFPVRELLLLASERSAGTELEFKGETLKVQPVREHSFKGFDLGLFSPGAKASEKYAPIAGADGCVVVDNTSRFRMEPDVPLVVPEVNPEAAERFAPRGIIANPNCSTIIMVVVLKPLHDAARVKRVVVSTYQSTSGAGGKAMEELRDQTAAILNMRPYAPRKFPHPIAFNLIPQIDVFLENGYTKEEMKMVEETRKIMGDPSIQVSPTTVRVPVFIGHSEALNVELERPLSSEAARQILSQAPGVKVLDDPAHHQYPMPVLAAGGDDTLVGRIRGDLTNPKALNLWIAGDNLRKGAALNAVQIAEYLVKRDLL